MRRFILFTIKGLAAASLMFLVTIISSALGFGLQLIVFCAFMAGVIFCCISDALEATL